MLKDLILRHSAHRFICKLVTILGGGVALVMVLVERVVSTAGVYWTAAPLVLFWLLDAGYAAEQRRCADLLKKNPSKEDPSGLLWEGGDVSLARFFRALISLSIWPFYVALFGLVAVGGDQVVKANRQAAAEVEARRPQPVSALPPYYQSGNLPGMPRRTSNSPIPFNQANPVSQRFTPSPFPTPPRFPLPTRPALTPPKLGNTPASSSIAPPRSTVTPSSPPSAPATSPAAPPAPAPKSP